MANNNPERKDAEKGFLRSYPTTGYFLCAASIAAVAYLMILILQLKLYEFDTTVLTTIMNVTVELLVAGSVFLVALEMIQNIYTPLVEIRNQLADIVRNLPKLPVQESVDQTIKAGQQLEPLQDFVRRLQNRYLLIRRMFIFGFLVVLVADLMLELVHSLFFSALSSLRGILFAVEIAMLVEALSVFLQAMHIAVGYTDKNIPSLSKSSPISRTRLCKYMDSIWKG